MVNGISSLQPKACTIVFCQFTLSPRDAASLASVSNMETRSSSSSARKDIVSKIQISERALAKRHPNRARFNSRFQQPIHACGKWIRGQHTALANTSLDFKPWVVSPTCSNTANRVVVKCWSAPATLQQQMPCRTIVSHPAPSTGLMKLHISATAAEMKQRHLRCCSASVALPMALYKYVYDYDLAT